MAIARAEAILYIPAHFAKGYPGRREKTGA
jgi:hypothetical protein